MSKSKYVLLLVIVLALLFWNPLTRNIIITVLPLGSGVDDLVFLVLLAAIVPVYIWYRSESTKSNWKRKQAKFFLIVSIAMAVITIATIILLV